MPLIAGSIAFTGFNGDGTDALAFVALENIAAGTVINFTDKEWTGSAFNSGEGSWSWTATSAVAVGTVIRIDNVGGTPTTNTGSVSGSSGLSNDSEIVYAYVGSMSSPTFLAAIGNNGPNIEGATLSGTGLTIGVNAIFFTGNGSDGIDIAAYNGPRGDQASFADYLSAINNVANWITQNTSSDDSSGTAPNAPFPTTGFTVAAPTGQSVSFSPANVSIEEGDSGTKTLTFIVTRTGGTTGAVSFAGTFAAGSTNAADFGGTLPSSTFSGTIAAGASTATVTIAISGDTTLENDESFTLTLTSATNPSAGVTIATASATGVIGNDDNGTVIAGNTSGVSFGNGDHVLVLSNVTVSGSNAVTWTGGGSAGETLDNFGNISGSTRGLTTGSSAGNLAVHNEAGATIQAVKDAVKVSNLGGNVTGSLTIVNDGTIKSTGTVDNAGQALDLDDIASPNAHTVITNNAGGLIDAADADAIRAGTNATINNYGTIVSHNASSASTGNDAIDFQAAHTGGVINNYAGGAITGARHGVTGDQPITVNNAGTITGTLGAGINMDSAAATTTVVNNSGSITGHASGATDGDGVDVDGQVAIDNSGTIAAIGTTTNGLNEALAIGGGSVVNEAGGHIVSDQRAITVDDSNDGSAFAAVTINNAGTIQGGNGEAISITGAFADTITNSGSIIGSVTTAGGADTLTNSGSITGNVFLGAGDDTVTLSTGSTITGTLSGGEGNDTVTLTGTGSGTLGHLDGVETVTIESGTWTFSDEGTATIAFTEGRETLVIDHALLADGHFADVIVGLGTGDAIDLKNIGTATSAMLGDGNVLTVAAASGNYTIQLDPNQDFTGKTFAVASDGQNGTSIQMTDTLTAGSIAFVGLNRDGNDHLAFVTLQDIAAGTVINFTEGQWDGEQFPEDAPRWSWTAGGDIAAGTVITLDDLNTETPVSNLGQVATVVPGELYTGSITIYAHTGDSAAPTAFLAAIADRQSIVGGGSLVGTGLTWSLTALDFNANYSGDIIAFNGAHVTALGFNDFLASINNPANWIVQSTGGDDSHDGTAPDVPFPTTPFVVDPVAQKVMFAPGSLQVTRAEGDVSLTFSFTVVRANGTTGAVAFSGVFDQGATDAADFAGTLPTTFSGVIADGAESATITIVVSDDRQFESDESFALTLTGVSSADVPVYLSGNQSDLVATGTIVNDDTVQEIGFSADTRKVFVSEGSDGTRTFTFVVERSGTGGTVGDVAFSGTFSFASGTDAADFGGTRPSAFSGVILDGQTSATVTVTVTGDTAPEGNNNFTLRLTAASNPAADAVAIATGGAQQAIGYILNDDGPLVVHNGETFSQKIGLSGQTSLTIEQGGAIAGFEFAGPGLDAVINNASGISGFSVSNLADGRVVFNNEATGVVTGRTEIGAMAAGGEFIINNAGKFTGAHKTIKAEGSANNYHITINNLATGVIDSGADGNSAIVVSNKVDLVNAGLIIVPYEADQGGAGGEAFEYTGTEVTVHNLAGGRIEGSHHAVTGDEAAVITNEAGAVMVGRNGSAVNIDNDSGVEDTVTIVNRGLMQGKSQNFDDSDGDAIDTDGLANIDNWGTIEGLGHNGYHNGEPNVSEGIATGGGIINNYAGGTIYGYGRAIQIDDSGNGSAFASTTIYNEGLIQGDGHLPTGVTVEELAVFEARIQGAEAINIVGDFADMVTNTASGEIVGGIKLAGGNDVLSNAGTITATGGSAIDMGEGNDALTNAGTISGNVLMGTGDDSVSLVAGETITGTLSGGDGTDTVTLSGTGAGTLGDIDGIETVTIDSGSWTLTDEGVTTVAFTAGNETLEIDHALLADGNFAATITGFAKGDVIDLKNIGTATSATLGDGNVLTIAGGDAGPITLQLDPNADYSDRVFTVASDGQNGTTIEMTNAPLTAGSIAFVGFNADGNDNLAFAVLQDISAGTVITFTDNEWKGSAFNTGESIWTWTATSDIAAGTIVTMDNLAAGLTASSNLGTIAWVDDTERNLNDATQGPLNADTVYAYIGNASSPTFLAAFSNGNYSNASTGYLTGTGLASGWTAVQTQSGDITVYNGPRLTGGDFSNFALLISNAQNWTPQSGAGDQSADGSAPDVPFSTAPLTIDPNAQKISFAAGSLTVTKAEGNSGTTLYTFTVARSGGTTGAVNFSGIFDTAYWSTKANAADYAGGVLPSTFSGTIAEGESSATVTVAIAGDTTFEPDESFRLILKSATNEAANVYLSFVAAEIQATGNIVNDDTQQTVGFAPANVFVTEGNDGTRTLVFTVERGGNGGTGGDLSFSGTFSKGGTDAADFGGVLPGNFSGVIAAGQTSATISITISGDFVIEGNESFTLRITSVSNSAGGNTAIATATATGWITNDDGPIVVHSGETATSVIALSGQDTLTIEEGGTLAGGLSVAGIDVDVTINNAGRITEAGFSSGNGSGRITLNNEVTGIITDQIQLPSFTATRNLDFVINNAGLINAGNKSIRSDGNTTYSHLTINNLATGVVDSGADNATAIEVEGNTTINNAGRIIVPAQAGTTSAGKEGIEYHGTGNVIHNLAGGWIEGSHHAVTGDEAVTVINEAGGTMIGRNGSAVNIDNLSAEANTVTVINYGLMQGKSQHYLDSDGDAIDVDGRVIVENWGSIEGLGHNGYHQGEPNVSEAIAAGAAVITNHEGGTIYGYGRAIQIDNSSNGDAFAATVIVNAGTIKGDGNQPTQDGLPPDNTVFTPEVIAQFAERIKGGEAIDIVGNLADTITNTTTGQIVGGIKMGGGNDMLSNAGTITATGGSAVDMGDGNDALTNAGTITGNVLMGAGDDSVSLVTGESITGTLSGGDGTDTVTLSGTGAGTLGDIDGIETVTIESGTWTLTDEGTATVAFTEGRETLVIDGGLLADGHFADTIVGLGKGDVIDLKNIGTASSATLGAGNVLTVTAAGGNVTIQLDPNQDFTGKTFVVSNDGQNGTNIQMTDTLGAGSIAFVGFNADGNDNLAFVAMNDIAAGTVIYFTDNEWTGSALNTGEGIWAWTATSNLAAGTVVTLDSLATQSPTGNYGSISYSGGTTRDITVANEIVYAYVGSTSAPTFLAAIGNDTFANGGGTLAGTGLIEGQTAISLAALGADADVAVYTGARGGLDNLSDYLALINNPSNWIKQDGNGNESSDHIAPDVPFVPTGFTDGNEDTQVVEFSASSVAVSHAEGDSGNTVFTFTVQRSGPVTGAVTFNGIIQVNGSTYGNDFAGGTVPTSFTGTIAAGQTTAEITVVVAGDTTYEQNNSFTLSFVNVANDAGAGTVIGSNAVATGTIVNDDAQEPEIAFVGYNAEGTDSMAFVALSDIAAGTVINFTDRNWTGTEFVVGNGSAVWSWTADGNIAAGTVITMDGISSTSATSNHGTITSTVTNDMRPDLGYSIFAYTGGVNQPSAFLTGMLLTQSSYQGPWVVPGTDLVGGVNAVVLTPTGYTAIAAYNGPRYGQSSIEDYASLINNTANWVVQNNTQADESADGTNPDAPLSTTPFTDDTAAQVVEFAANSIVTRTEGDAGTTVTFTFTVVRSNGSTGDLAFTAAVKGEAFSGATLPADFGGTFPVVSGVIADGQTSTTVTITVTGDSYYELNETFHLVLQSASNPNASSVVIGTGNTATGTITNDDNEPGHIYAGEVVNRSVSLTGADVLTIDAGGALDISAQGVSTTAVDWSSGNVTIQNSGDLLTSTVAAANAVKAAKNITGSFTFTNEQGARSYGDIDVHQVATSAVVTITNAGLISSLGKTIEMNNAAQANQSWIHNLATGVITSDAPTSDIIRAGQNVLVENAGRIVARADLATATAASGDAVDFQGNTGGVVHNLAGGLIEGSRHAITGDHAVTVINEAGATLIGRNGSGVNIDNGPAVSDTVHITNRGDIFGKSQNYADSDGDAVDTDGLAIIDNWGTIKGLGHNGYHDGEPNVSEGIAIGGGVINNYAGAEIYGYGRAIEIDDSSNGPGFAATTVYNEGLIKGDGNLPTGVTPEEWRCLPAASRAAKRSTSSVTSLTPSPIQPPVRSSAASRWVMATTLSPTPAPSPRPAARRSTWAAATTC